jgi:hypothetical protein
MKVLETGDQLIGVVAANRWEPHQNPRDVSQANQTSPRGEVDEEALLCKRLHFLLFICLVRILKQDLVVPLSPISLRL